MRLAVVSPFLDRSHGTEMCVAEQVERLAQRDGWRIELYAQKVSEVNGVVTQQKAGGGAADASGIYWHPVSDIPGPHLLKFLWWFAANHWRRKRDRQRGRVNCDLVYTPGTNCADADAIAVHIVFHAFYEQARRELQFSRVPIKTWPLLLHRKLYYQLIMFLERKIYRNPRITLIAVSKVIARQLEKFVGRTDVVVIPNMVDLQRFNPQIREARRTEQRREFQISGRDFVILLIGNDWKKKGLDSLLRAMARLRDLPLRVMVAGKDDRGLYAPMVQKLGLEERVSFENPSSDVMKFYAAADLYTGPSLEDAFNLPILESMACGVPVIASSFAGASENVEDGQNGLILREPTDDEALAGLIRRLYEDGDLRRRLAQNAAEFVRENCSWEKNTNNTREVLEGILQQRQRERGASAALSG
jgi:UDP-glucose:(heptosyl)LPS alpha-1,3-glucosyltransferase